MAATCVYNICIWIMLRMQNRRKGGSCQTEISIGGHVAKLLAIVKCGNEVVDVGEVGVVGSEIAVSAG